MVTLDLNRINAHSPYRLVATHRPLFAKFTTDYGVNYTIGLSYNDLLSAEETYEFILINANNHKSPRDFKVKETVIAFLYEFFSQSNKAVLYLCDTGDDKQYMRHRLFESWYNSSPWKGYLCRCTTSLADAEGIMNFVSVIFRSDNPHAAEISVEFTRTVQLLSEKPE